MQLLLRCKLRKWGVTWQLFQVRNLQYNFCCVAQWGVTWQLFSQLATQHFVALQVTKWGVTRQLFSQLAMQLLLRCKSQEKMPYVT